MGKTAMATALRDQLASRSLYISDRKIDALLYLAQRINLAVNDDPLFTNPIIATSAGVRVDDLADGADPDVALTDGQFAVLTATVSRYGNLPAMDLEAMIRGQLPWSAARQTPGRQIDLQQVRDLARAQEEEPDGTVTGIPRSARTALRRPAGAGSPGPGTPDSADEIAAFIADTTAGR